MRDAFRRLGFPWLTPHPSKISSETGYFQAKISDSDLYEMYKRNQMAHQIVFNVALDVLAGGFTVQTEEGIDDPKFDADIQRIYRKFIHQPLLKAYLQARLYGSSGILIGYNDSRGFDSPANPKNKISYLFSIPHDWVTERSPKEDQQGIIIPPELGHYELSSTSTTTRLDASRLVHIQPLSLEENFDGESALHCVFDALTVLKNMDWGTGQTMFRQGAGLTTITAGPDADQDDIDAITEAVGDINARTVITFPHGCEVQTHRPGALDPDTFYNVIVNQIAAGANIPVSILLGAQRGGVEASSKDRKDYADFLASIQRNDLTGPLTRLIKIFQDSGQLEKREFTIKWATPSIFLLDASQAKLYEARAELELARAKTETARYAYLQKLRRSMKEQEEVDPEKVEATLRAGGAGEEVEV